MKRVDKFDNLIEPTEDKFIYPPRMLTQADLERNEGALRLDALLDWRSRDQTNDSRDDEESKGWQEGKKLGSLTLIEVPAEYSEVTQRVHRKGTFIFQCKCGRRVTLNY